MAGPNVGDVIDGYEFLGGNPNDQKSWAFWGEGVRSLPDGSIVKEGPRGGLNVLRQGNRTSAGGLPDVKEFQSKAAAQSVLMDQALTDYDQARSQGYDPASWKNRFAMGLEGAMPRVGPFFADVLRDNPSERGRAAELAYTEGALRALTGAAATDPETRRTARNMFRQPGESVGVEPNKQAVRERFAGTIQRIAGPAFVPSGTATAPRGRGENADGRSAPAGFRERLTPAQRQAAQKFRGATAPSGKEQNPYAPTTEQEFERLPVGSFFINPADGQILRKAR